jgi:hypothetical protein
VRCHSDKGLKNLAFSITVFHLVIKLRRTYSFRYDEAKLYIHALVKETAKRKQKASQQVLILT